jgi:ferredoxin
MSEKEIPIHYVCTREKAQELIDRQKHFWVSNCGCREGNKEGCKRSRIDVCLMWADGEGSSGSDKHPATRAEVDAIMKEAKDKCLVYRPFRNDARTDTEGICFCCDDCCGYFQPGSTYRCDQGEKIEQTKVEDCTNCGACEPVCYFKARQMKDGALALTRDKCYGCGLCVDVCPTSCITLATRKREV